MHIQTETNDKCKYNCCRLINIVGIICLLLIITVIAQCNISAKVRQSNSVIKIVSNAEKDIDADIVVAPINLIMSSSEINTLTEDFKKKIGIFKDFLSQNNIMLDDLEISMPSIYPQYDQSIESGVEKADKKFIIKVLMLIRSKDIEKVEKMIAQLPKLNTTKNTEITINTYQTEYQISPDLLHATVSNLTAKAAENAIEDAKQLATRTGVTIIGINNISCDNATIINSPVTASQAKNKKISTAVTVEMKIKPHKKKMDNQE